MRYLLILIVVTTSLMAEEMDTKIVENPEAPRIFIDCRHCDMGFIRTEIDYVNYVIDRNDAEIFIMNTREHTGSGGQKYTMTFEGRDQFEGMRDTLHYTTTIDDSDDEARVRMTSYLKLGLVRYLTHTPLAGNLRLEYDDAVDQGKPEDKWNNWVFRIRLNGWFNGESSYRSTNLRSNFNISKTTEDWKIDLSVSASNAQSEYDIDDEVLKSRRQNFNLFSSVIKSLTDHWSIGIGGGANSSTYNNIKSSVWVTPAIEYNIFPYSESTRRELRLQYELGYDLNHYDEITIYDKTEERLLSEKFGVFYEIKQPWGSVDITLRGSHYFHDFAKNHLSLYTDFSFKMFKGFSLNLHGGYSRIHDQLSIPKGEITEEEILLHQRQLETQYSYWGSLGVSYTFGSIYNNIVNPRFG